MIIFEQLHQLRVSTDLLIQLAQRLAERYSGRIGIAHWQADAYKKLVFLKGHLGKLKGYLGEPTPYKTAGTIASIPPTDAVFEGALPEENNELHEINLIRDQISRLKKDIGDFMDWDDVHEAANALSSIDFFFFQTAKLRVILLADEASICYGMRLREMKEDASVLA